VAADTDPVLTDEEFARLDRNHDGIVHLEEERVRVNAMKKETKGKDQ